MVNAVMTEPKVLISEAELSKRLDELAQEINTAYANQAHPLIIICVLKGAILFCSDLMKRLKINCRVEFVRLQSYGAQRYSSGQVKVIDSLGVVLPDLNERNVLIIEDIVDTGLTLKHFVSELNHNWKPESVKVAVLLDKKEMRQHEVGVDFCGFEIPNHFVVGYGLDDNELMRNLPYIGLVE